MPNCQVGLVLAQMQLQLPPDIADRRNPDQRATLSIEIEAAWSGASRLSETEIPRPTVPNWPSFVPRERRAPAAPAGSRPARGRPIHRAVLGYVVLLSSGTSFLFVHCILRSILLEYSMGTNSAKLLLHGTNNKIGS